jgi:hypothetical protein
VKHGLSNSSLVLAGVCVWALNPSTAQSFCPESHLILRVRVAMRTVSYLMERCFATFAGVTYHDALYRQQWEQLWETESNNSHTHVAAVRVAWLNLFHF